MSSSEIEAAWAYQIYNYASCSMSFLVIYRTALNMDQEVDLIWAAREGSSKCGMALYALLTYGGLCNAALMMLSVSNTALTYNICWFTFLLSAEILPTILFAGLNAMMGLRVYAIYEGSKAVLIFLATCYIMIQGLAVAEICLSMVSFTIDASCQWKPTYAQAWLSVVSPFGMCGYDVILLVMVVYRVFREMRSEYGGSLWGFNTLLSVLARDHAFYFSFAIFARTVVAVSYFPWEKNFLFLWLCQAATAFSACMLGPIMFLSIRQFDAKRARGGRSNEADIVTMWQVTAVDKNCV